MQIMPKLLVILGQNQNAPSNVLNGSKIQNRQQGGVAEWLRLSASNHARSTRVGSNPVVGTTNHKPTVNSAVHPSEMSTQK